MVLATLIHALLLRLLLRLPFFLCVKSDNSDCSSTTKCIIDCTFQRQKLNIQMNNMESMHTMRNENTENKNSNESRLEIPMHAYLLYLITI